MRSDQVFTERLFAYGTLQDVDVQFRIFGRALKGEPDALPEYRIIMSETADAKFAAASGSKQHRNLQFTGVAADVVEGTVFHVSQSEIEQADAYEPTDYRRKSVRLRSGCDAWVYSSNPNC